MIDLSGEYYTDSLKEMAYRWRSAHYEGPIYYDGCHLATFVSPKNECDLEKGWMGNCPIGIKSWYKEQPLSFGRSEVCPMRGSKLSIRYRQPHSGWGVRVYEYDYYFAEWLGKKIGLYMSKKNTPFFFLFGKRDFLTDCERSIWRDETNGRSPSECFKRELYSAFCKAVYLSKYGDIQRAFDAGFCGNNTKKSCEPRIEIIKNEKYDKDSEACVMFINTLHAGKDEEKRSSLIDLCVEYGRSSLLERAGNGIKNA